MGSEPRTFGLEVKFTILCIVDTPPIESQQETISMPVQSRCLGPGFESPDRVFTFFDFPHPILSNGLVRDKKRRALHDFALHTCTRAMLLFSVSFNFSICTAEESKIWLTKIGVLFLMILSDLNQNINTHSTWGAHPGPFDWKSISLSWYCWYFSPREVNRNPFQCLSRRLGPGFESPDRIFTFSIFPLLSYQMG